ncbi:type II toxin-antitoxin system RelE/ParE family toxin [bacterium]|nr:type II toxin-antitoxin system RelE/ParE family toxin [bacterium]
MRILKSAANEARTALNYYRTKSPDLALAFASELDNSFSLITRNPMAFPAYASDVRKFTMHGFPFNIIYTLRDSEILILAIAHQRRKPDYWKNRPS